MMNVRAGLKENEIESQNKYLFSCHHISRKGGL